MRELFIKRSLYSAEKTNRKTGDQLSDPTIKEMIEAKRELSEEFTEKINEFQKKFNVEIAGMEIEKTYASGRILSTTATIKTEGF